MNINESMFDDDNFLPNVLRLHKRIQQMWNNKCKGCGYLKTTKKPAKKDVALILWL